ncbi:MAG: carboxypeptidase regulatory-like domain-containing protein [Gemmatimonadota bacterium]
MLYSRSLSHLAVRAIGLSLIGASLCAGAIAAQTPECPGYDADDGIVWGFVRAMEGGVAVPAADITVRWAGGDTRAQSLHDGVYIVCGVRPNLPLTVQAGFQTFSGMGVAAQLSPGETLEVPLSVAFGDGGAVAVTGRVVGRVIDSQTLRPISNALIGAGDQGFTGVTDGGGRFQLDDVAPGLQMISVRHLAYGETESRFSMPRDGTLEIEVRLNPEVLPVEPIEVEIVGVRSLKLEISGFYERREWNDRLGLGSYVTRRDIEARAAAQVSHVLAEIPRLSFYRGGCFGSRCDFPVFSGTSAYCGRLKEEGGEYRIGASIYVNNVRQRMATGGVAMGIDDLVKPGDVAGIEVYSGSGDLPGEFSDVNAQRCGAIVIWTGR